MGYTWLPCRLTKMTPLSAVVTTYNNADTLLRCLASTAGLVDELVIIDSFSNDATMEIAASYTSNIVQKPFEGFAAQKQFAVDSATHDWILLLDADEALSPALQAEISALKLHFLEAPGYRLRRREWLAWKSPIEKHGRWQHPWVKLTDHLRLFDRRVVKLSQHPVHAAPFTHLPAPILKNDLYHWGDAPFSRRRIKARAYASHYSSQKGNWKPVWKLLLAPVWAFFQDYLLRRGFMNPVLGFTAALHSAYACYLKYRNQLRF